ncbi:hypothetical protein BP6252_01394 [Coleophoma cylindrospora]|uniref:Hemerythrin-like domain-containing protein n=1 Tax=Coleophoma cylindrospora TaxID=1849047 RepID=A0A3D8SST8_9HELO|nr:hypothetical protein BP6252_01394 [Coleophoma cylindrospora]
MAGLCEGENAAAGAKMQEPASTEQEILNGNPSGPAAAKEVETTKPKAEEKPLPKLSAAEFQAYNSMAEHMEYFHNHFRQTWTMIYNSCINNKRPAGLSLKQFISTGLQLISHLTVHHNIEEAHIFPVLATKMPEFKAGKNAAELLRQHKEIHKGMDGFQAYLEKCRSGETELELRVLKQQMDTWGDVLWKHLDQEVVTLGAENMRKYWTVAEMRRMPM